MPAKIRVFVSSTMDDLANEREAVIDAIQDLNFEPVNAEGILPNGATSWDVLEPEIQSSHICILLQGDRYGWIPTEGYGAGLGKSVTHLEIDTARRARKPILPFFKELKYGVASKSVDARLRDRFRKEIGDWKDGQFRAEFRGANDLRKKARQALLDALATSWLREAVEAEVARTPPLLATIFPDLPPPPAVDPTAPPEVLFAGAGLSLSAGLPSANALAGVVGRALRLDPDQTSRHSLAHLFELVEFKFGREKMIEIVAGVLNPPVPVEPTMAHMAAVRHFPVILTTNYDHLFERACEMLELPYVVRTPNGEKLVPSKPGITIFKIDGSADNPESLVLSPGDTERARGDGSFWNEVADVLQKSSPVVIGHSLRDITSRSLMRQRNRTLRGVYVAPLIDPVDGLLIDGLNLEGVECAASDYFSQTPS